MSAVNQITQFKKIIKGVLPAGIKNRVIPRKIHAYCVGMPKTGTTSIYAMLDSNYRSEHEPEYQVVSRFLYSNPTREEKIDFFKKRDEQLWLELESSWFIGHCIDVFVEQFKEAKFIFTVRDCYSWLDSIINNQINYQHPDDEDYDHTWLKVLFGELPQTYADEEKVLAEYELYSLDTYLSYWANENEKILNAIPSDRVLLIRTHELSNKKTAIADFLGISLDTFDQRKQASNQALAKHHVLDKIDSDYLEEKYEKHCSQLMQRLFPDFKR